MGYRAFFSYARADDRTANWLHRQLDSYRTPKALVGSEGLLGAVPAKLHPIFRDRTDLSAGNSVSESLQQALEESETLIVLCTPTSARSHWVNHECETFLSLGRADRIFPVIADGEPDSSDPSRECFAPVLRGKGLLAADLRELRRPNGQMIGDGREMGRLKLIAGLLGVPLDALIRRERRRQRLTLLGFGAATIVFACLAVASVWFGLEAEEQRRETFNSLARIFAERSWQAMERENYQLAARYALAGWHAAPENEAEYRLALSRLLHGANESRALTGASDGGPIHQVAFAHNGAQFATTSIDGKVRLWSASGQILFVLSDLTAAIDEIRYSPDSTRIAAASSDGVVCVWDVASGHRLLVINVPREKVGTAHLAFSPDGKLLAATGEDSPAHIWDATSGAMRVTLHAPMGAGYIEFSPDGRLVVTTQATEGVARLWDTASGASIGVFPQHASGEAKFSPDGTRLVTASTDETAALWDVRTRKMIAELPHRGVVTTVSFSPNGETVLTTSYDGVAALWDGHTGALIVELHGHAGRIQSGVFSADGGRVLTASLDHTARLWDAGTGVEIGVLRGHEDEVYDGAFSPNGNEIVTVGALGQIRLWTAPLGRDVSRLQTDQLLTSASLSPDGRRLVSSSDDGALTLWNADSGAKLRQFARLEGAGSLAFVGRDTIYAGASDGIHMFRAGDGSPEGAIAFSAADLVAYALDGSRVLVSNGEGAVIVFAAPSGRKISAIRMPEPEVVAANFSPDGERVVTSTKHGSISLWDATTGRKTADLESDHGLGYSAKFSPDGKRIVTAMGDGVVVVWDLQGRQVGQLRGHQERVLDATFSPDGKSIATASMDRTVRIWDGASGRELAVFNGDGVMRDVSFSGHGGRIVATSWDNASDNRVWDVSRFSQPIETLARAACEQLLQPRGGAFSAPEVGADPLIGEVWLNGNKRTRDVCTGLPR
ncbi:MAG: toll/interleukin-1 receptor domain-containing protein [Sphingomonadales bacterium]